MLLRQTACVATLQRGQLQGGSWSQQRRLPTSKALIREWRWRDNMALAVLDLKLSQQPTVMPTAITHLAVTLRLRSSDLAAC